MIVVPFLVRQIKLAKFWIDLFNFGVC